MPGEGTSTALTIIEGGSTTAANLGLGPPSVNEIASLRTMAAEIAQTEFVPSGLRGRAPAVLAAILTGRELGIGPMAALKQIAVIDGKPTLSAELMLALIRRAGHKVEGPEPTDTGAALTGIRRDTGKPLTVTFDEADARKAQLLGKPSWQRYPRSMYWARCVSMLARMHFSDVLMGMVYTPEEMGAEVDEDNQIIEMRQTTGVEAKLAQAMKTPDAPAKEVTPSTTATTAAPSASPTRATSAGAGDTQQSAVETQQAKSQPAPAAPPASGSPVTAPAPPNASPGAATASPSPVAATPSPASAEPDELAFGEAQSDTATELRRQATELSIQATRLYAEKRTPGTQYPDSIIEGKARLGIDNFLKNKRGGIAFEQATSEDLMALIDAIQVTLG